MNIFLEAYIECALQSTPLPDGTDSLSDSYTINDLTADCIARMTDDCQAFEQLFGQLFGVNAGQAGHDFWLVRNHLGDGFGSSTAVNTSPS